jgi:anthranilate phosphoribosyltransferase
MSPILADVQQSRGVRTIVVRSDEGLDELSTSSTSQVWDVTTDEVRHSVLDPAALGLAPATMDQLRGGDPAFNADVVRAIVAGRSDGNLAAIRDVVALNAAGALVAYDAASGLNHFGDPSEPVAKRIALALPVAYESLDSGAAATVLNVLISVSQRFALSAG